MNVIICIDEKNGLMFNRRRQSRDRAVIEKVLDIAKNQKLWLREFSRELFNEKIINQNNHIFIDNEMLKKAATDDFCFVEDIDLFPYTEQIQKIYLFKWNRTYPQDFSLKLDVETLFKRVYAEDFTGKSHEMITLEVWGR